MSYVMLNSTEMCKSDFSLTIIIAEFPKVVYLVHWSFYYTLSNDMFRRH